MEEKCKHDFRFVAVGLDESYHARGYYKCIKCGLETRDPTIEMKEPTSRKYANKKMINLLPKTYYSFKEVMREMNAHTDNEALETLVDYWIATGGNNHPKRNHRKK